ncbi:hypothetical protein GGI10_003050, partial [Coemansia sp. RSA 2530]
MADEKSLSFNQVREISNTGTFNNLAATILDVRSAAEVDGGRIPNAVNIPIGELGQALGLATDQFKKKYQFVLPERNSKTEALLIYCKSGTRTKMARDILEKDGYKDNLYVYLGGWDDLADLFGPHVGYLAMSMYIGVSMLILYNILIGVINQCMVEITQNAAQEFRFAYTMRVAEYVSANQTYPCVPPLNFLQIFAFWPLRKTTTLSRRSFALIRSLVLLVAYAPHLVIYALYKNV